MGSSRWLALGVLLACGCGARDPSAVDAGPAAIDAGAETFVALNADIADYRSWRAMELPDGETGQGTRYIYANRLPPAGSTRFPVGTILVKESTVFSQASAVLQVDAMVKRGGGFNGGDGGARGWEWMGLTPSDAGASIAWRGSVPPASAGYGPLLGQCNACHLEAEANDDVQIPVDDGGRMAAAPLVLGGR